ncbi:beta strand repeat-containing protein [Paludibaculum fermentans]|uniref:beta strand repeat-containing protein n=1 Tax=Paludibaculum fermentans TaxID=1473598 RepID=UPI003EBBFE1A
MIFQSSFAGSKTNYLIAFAQYGFNSGWRQVGTWNVPGAAPVITALSPSAGPIGAGVTISGSNFGSGGTISFGGVPATPTSWTATSITTKVPTGAATGNVFVTVGGVSSNSVPFSISSTPVITSLSSTSGPVGASIVISGANFGSSQGTNTVKFHGLIALVSSWSSTSIIATVPTGATSGNVVVTVGGNSSNGVNFTVSSGPGISSLTPNLAPIGATVIISGTNFGATQATSTVTFNSVSASVQSWSATSITVTVPTGAVSGNVVVNVGVASNGVPFTVVQAPSITSVAPNTGQPGTTVIVSGSGFGGAQGMSSVKFSGVTASVSSWSSSSITTAVPGGANTGNVTVTVAGVASNGVLFTVTNAPTITAISPSSGPIGATVSITGTSFGTTQCPTCVKFNGTQASVVTAWNTTNISVVIPSGATSGNVVVTIGGIASNGFDFSVAPPPTISAIAPTSGAIGTAVTLSGSNFGATQGGSTVKFNGTNAVVISWSSTSIIAQVPAGATNGLVSVSVNSSVAYSPQTFTVTATAAPNITSITPSTGAIGTSVVITGTNFGASQGSSTVGFNGTAATAISWSNTSIVAVVPAGTINGTVVVRVNAVSSNPMPFSVGAAPPTREYIRMGGRLLAIENSAAQVLPFISSLSATSGGAGTAVTISGTGFGTSGTVTFNGTAVTTITSWSATSISTSVPVGATPGNVVVTVNGYSSNGVLFNVSATETVSAPTVPSGPSIGFTTGVYSYTASGAISSLSNPVQYIFYWGDGTDSGWLPSGTTTASHTWTTSGNNAVTVKARSAPNPTAISAVSASLTVVVSVGTATLNIGSGFHTYDTWTMWVSSNVPNEWFTLCARFPSGSVSCTPNKGQTDSSGIWNSAPGTFPPGNMGVWTEWIVFPVSGVRSANVTFTVLDGASLSISSGFHVGDGWTISLESTLPNTWFTICAYFPDGSQSCTPNYDYTDTNGNWTSTGSFRTDDIGAWSEWIVFPTATSNSIPFTVIE